MKNRIDLLEKIMRDLRIEEIQYKPDCDMSKVKNLEEQADIYDRFARKKLKREYLDLDLLKQSVADAVDIALRQTTFLFNGELNCAVSRIKNLTNAINNTSLVDMNKKLKSDGRYKVEEFGKVIRECAVENSRFVQVDVGDVNVSYSNGIDAGCKSNQLIYFRDLRAVYKSLGKGFTSIRPSLTVEFDFSKLD
ncbi:MAG: hypothetical protein AABW82_03590 [Nanoarchaeota archaeon]